MRTGVAAQAQAMLHDLAPILLPSLAPSKHTLPTAHATQHWLTAGKPTDAVRYDQQRAAAVAQLDTLSHRLQGSERAHR